MTRKRNARANHQKPAEPVALPAIGEAGPAPLALTGDRLKLWTDIRTKYRLDSASEALLRNGCEALERAAHLAVQVTTEGATFRDRFGGLKTNPAATLERDFRGLAARTLAQLSARFEG